MMQLFRVQWNGEKDGVPRRFLYHLEEEEEEELLTFLRERRCVVVVVVVTVVWMPVHHEPVCSLNLSCFLWMMETCSRQQWAGRGVLLSGREK